MLIFSAPLTADGEDDVTPVAFLDYFYGEPSYTGSGGVFDLTETTNAWALYWSEGKLDPSQYTEDSFNVQFDFSWTAGTLGSLSSDFTIWRLGDTSGEPPRYDSLFVRVEDGDLNLYVRYVDDEDDVTELIGAASASSTIRIEYTTGTPGTVEYFVDDVSSAGPYSLAPPTDGLMFIGSADDVEARAGLESFTFLDVIAYSGEIGPEPQVYELTAGHGDYDMSGFAVQMTYSSAEEARPPELKPWYYIPGPVPWFR